MEEEIKFIENELKQLVLERRRLRYGFRVNREIMHDDFMFKAALMDYSCTLSVALETYLYQHRVDNFCVITKTPKNCWEHFKEDFFPEWIKASFPVQYDEQQHRYEVKAVYPKLTGTQERIIIVEKEGY